jgi:hypothetical protein
MHTHNAHTQCTHTHKAHWGFPLLCPALLSTSFTCGHRCTARKAATILAVSFQASSSGTYGARSLLSRRKTWREGLVRSVKNGLGGGEMAEGGTECVGYLHSCLGCLPACLPACPSLCFLVMAQATRGRHPRSIRVTHTESSQHTPQTHRPDERARRDWEPSANCWWLTPGITTTGFSSTASCFCHVTDYIYVWREGERRDL